MITRLSLISALILLGFSTPLHASNPTEAQQEAEYRKICETYAEEDNIIPESMDEYMADCIKGFRESNDERIQQDEPLDAPLDAPPLETLPTQDESGEAPY